MVFAFLTEVNLVVIGLMLQSLMHSCIIKRTFFIVEKVVNTVVDVVL